MVCVPRQYLILKLVFFVKFHSLTIKIQKLVTHVIQSQHVGIF